MASVARKTLRLGMIPADGIGKEVLPVRFSVLYRLSLPVQPFPRTLKRENLLSADCHYR